MRRILGGIAGLVLTAGQAVAHPHVYIDSGLHLIFDDEGRLAAVRVIWAYDELYSLLVLEDMGLDSDYDGVLTAQETARLDGFDMAWDPDFAGDLYADAGGAEIAFSRPLEHTAELRDGRIVTMHTRALERRIDPAEVPVAFRIYDPSFYTAYTVSLPTRIEGREGCAAQLFAPEMDAANAQLLAALQELGATDMVNESDFPAIGAAFAEEIRLTCAPRS